MLIRKLAFTAAAFFLGMSLVSAAQIMDIKEECQCRTIFSSDNNGDWHIYDCKKLPDCPTPIPPGTMPCVDLTVVIDGANHYFCMCEDESALDPGCDGAVVELPNGWDATCLDHLAPVYCPPPDHFCYFDEGAYAAGNDWCCKCIQIQQPM